MAVVEMKPSDIRFTQDSIAEHFNDNSSSLEETFRQLMYNPTMNLPRIRVTQDGGVYWAMYGNRRLYVYQALQRYGRIDHIMVDVMPYVDKQKFDAKKTTKNEGRSVYIRQDRGKPRQDKLEARLARIYQQWQLTENRTSRQDMGDGSNWLNNYNSLSRTSTNSQRSSPASVQPQHINYQSPSSRSVYDYSTNQRPTSPPPRTAPPKDDSWCTIL